MIGDAKLRLAGAYREGESVTVLFNLRHRGCIDPLPAGSLCLRIVYYSALRNIEFEIGVAHLRARRPRNVIHGEKPHDREVAFARLQIH